MKVITITENNIKEVYGRLKKFFYNSNTTGFEEWHNFDCGFKKHISPVIYIGKDKIRNINTYPSPNNVKYMSKGSVPGISYSYILVRLTATNSFSLQPGDKISFCGNRIIYRHKSILRDHNYTYSVFQACAMRKDRQKELRMIAELESTLFDEDCSY